MTITVSSKFQVLIPQEVRKKLSLKKGQKMTVIVKGGMVYLIPEKPLDQFRGFLKGMDTGNIREHEER